MFLEANRVPAYLRGGYTGKTFQAQAAEQVTIPSHAGLWDGGSRTTYNAIELATGRTVTVSDNMSAPWSDKREDRIIPLQSGLAVVKHSIFCGKDMGLTFYVHPSDIVKLVPDQAQDDLTEQELQVLAIIRGIKSSYRADCYSRKNISAATVEEIKGKLTSLGYLNKAGAITVAGRNRSANISAN